MGTRETARLIFDRRKFNGEYQSYARKKEYYDAIAAGDSAAAIELSARNYKYPSEVFARSDSYSDAVYRYYYEAICAASEMCLVAIQSGLPDMVAYDVRDRYVEEFDRVVSLPDIYDLIHGMTHEFALRVAQSRREQLGSANLAAMLTYIEENLHKPIALQDVAEAANLSRTYASALFHKELGMTFSEWLLRERIAEACRLLDDRRLSLSEIADRLQFCSLSYFGQSFKRVRGVTPSEYRAGKRA